MSKHFSECSFRIGYGYDVHQLEEGLPLWLGGIKITHTHGLKGHSDADVAIHALCDAILGACALGDIGKHFPPSDEKYKGIDSKILLKEVIMMIHQEGYKIGNADLTIAAEKPKLLSHIDNMRECLSNIMDCLIDQISIKATTTEKLGFTGREEGISASAIVLIYKANED